LETAGFDTQPMPSENTVRMERRGEAVGLGRAGGFAL